MFRVNANIDLAAPLAEIGEMARRAEALGFDCVSIPDVCHDGLLAATLAAGATARIEIANSALVCFPRAPMTTAVAVWDLQAFSRGRYRLGLGPLVAPNIVQKYGTAWYPPAPRMRDYVQTMRAIFDCWQRGAPADHRGPYYQFTRQQPFTAPPPIDHPDIPLHLAAIGPNMTALAGEIADGLSMHPTNCSPRFIREMTRGQLARGAARTARDPAAIEITVNPFCATGSTSDAVAAARESFRATLGTLFSTPNYWPSLTLFGWSDLGDMLRRLIRDGRWADTAGLVGDEMLDAFVISAPYDGLADLLRAQFGGLAGRIGLALPRDPRDDAALARAVAGLKAP